MTRLIGKLLPADIGGIHQAALGDREHCHPVLIGSCRRCILNCRTGVRFNSIGRGAGNDWVLPDPDRHLSKTHCVISIENGRTVLTDLSTNGVYINGARQPTSRDSRVVLTDGDDFRLGEYTIEVTVDNLSDYAGVLLLTVSWVFANPPGNAPDEPSHYVKSIGSAFGQLVPPHTTGLPSATPADRYARSVTGTFTKVPGAYIPSSDTN